MINQYQIAANEHFPRHLRVTRLVGSKQRQTPEAVEVKSDDDEKQESLGKR